METDAALHGVYPGAHACSAGRFKLSVELKMTFLRQESFLKKTLETSVIYSYSLMEIVVPNSEASFVSISLPFGLITKDMARSRYGICKNPVQPLLLRGARRL